MTIGDKVYDKLKRKYGIIKAIVGGDEKRYYVQHSGYLWSVPEKYLTK